MAYNRSRSTEIPQVWRPSKERSLFLSFSEFPSTLREIESPPKGLSKERPKSSQDFPSLHGLLLPYEETGSGTRSYNSSMALSQANTVSSATHVVRRSTTEEQKLFQARKKEVMGERHTIWDRLFKETLHKSNPGAVASVAEEQKLLQTRKRESMGERSAIWDRLFKETLHKSNHGAVASVAEEQKLFQARKKEIMVDRSAIWDRLSKTTLHNSRHAPKHPTTIDWDTLEPPPRKANERPAKPARTISPKVKKVQLEHVEAHPPSTEVVLYTPHYGTKDIKKVRKEGTHTPSEDTPSEGRPPVSDGRAPSLDASAHHGDTAPRHRRTASNFSDFSEITDTTTTSAGAFRHHSAQRSPAKACSEADLQSEATDFSVVDRGSVVGQGDVVQTVDYKRALKNTRSNRAAHACTTRELLKRGAEGKLSDNDDE